MEHKMTIGIDASRANKVEKTGVEWYAFHLIQEFKKLIPGDFRVILYSAEPLMGELGALPPNWESKIIKGVNLGRGPWLWTQLGLTWEMIKNRSDILFVPSHAIPLIHPKRTYTTIHDIGFEVFPESYGFLARLYHRFSARLALRSATKIFTPSEFTKQELIKYYHADSSKIIVTPLGFDSTKYCHPRVSGDPEEQIPPLKIRGAGGSYDNICENPLEIRGNPGTATNTNQIFGATTHSPYILFVGRIEKKKNVKRLIQAFLELKKEISPPARGGVGGGGSVSGDPEKAPGSPEAPRSPKVDNPSPPVGEGRERESICENLLSICENPEKENPIHNLKLVIVGLPGFGYNEIKASAANSKDVIFPGYVPSADLPRILAGAEVYALPSLYEGFGIPILEAMASGVPVLTSNTASMPEVACKTSPFDKGGLRGIFSSPFTTRNPSERRMRSTPPERGEGFLSEAPPFGPEGLMASNGRSLKVEISPFGKGSTAEPGGIFSPPYEGGARGGQYPRESASNPWKSEMGNPETCAAHLVDPLSVSSIKDGLKKILTDQMYRDNLISRGFIRAREFSWEITARKTLDPIMH